MNEQAGSPLEANEINFRHFGDAEARGLRDTAEVDVVILTLGKKNK